MDYLLWRHKDYQEYYNCSFYKVEDVPFETRHHPFIGSTFIILFVIFETLYIPSLLIMFKKKFRQQACYKIMIYVGIIDVSVLFVNGLSTGLLAAIGAVYCSSPVLINLLGEVGLGCWVAQSDAGMILALNRCLEMYDPFKAKSFFNGKKVYLWLMIPTLHSLGVVFFTKSVFFSSILISWFFNPHIGYYDDFGTRYANWFHTINNITLLFVLFFLYGIFLFFYLRKTSHVENNDSNNKNDNQRNTFIQVFIICSITAIAAAIYVYEQFFPVNGAFILVGSYAWLCAHGAPSVIYLTMNRTIRKELKKICGCRVQITFTNGVIPSNANTGSTNNASHASRSAS